MWFGYDIGGLFNIFYYYWGKENRSLCRGLSYTDVPLQSSMPSKSTIELVSFGSANISKYQVQHMESLNLDFYTFHQEKKNGSNKADEV